jgi:hypothetical protein
MKRSSYLVALVLLIPTLSTTLVAADWTRFRGADGLGVCTDTESIPTTWSDTENLQWKVALPGPGSSSAIVLGERVYVTCYSGVVEESVEQLKRHLVCVDRNSGEIVWNTVVAAEQPEDPYQGFITQHGYASHTPVTDGERIYVFMGKSGVRAFDLSGKELWKAEVGKESSPMRWGSGTSPVLYKDYVIVNSSDESQSIRALDKKTGKEVWKAEASSLDNAYGTPALVETADGRKELVIAVGGEMWGLNPDNGKLRWYAATGTQGGVYSSPVASGDIAFSLGGRGAGSIAVRAGGRSDVTDSHVEWSNTYSSSVPSPLLYDGRLYWLDDRGIARCVAADSGELVYQSRLEGFSTSRGEGGSSQRGGGGGFGRGGGPAVYASPTCADGKIYLVSRFNGVFVVAAKSTFEQLAHNKFESDDSQFNGSPAVSNGQMFLRSDKFLYCIAEEK